MHQLLLLVRPGGRRLAVRGLLGLEGLLCRCLRGACCLVICRAGLLLFGEIRGSLARGYPLTVDVGKDPAFVRNVGERPADPP